MTDTAPDQLGSPNGLAVINPGAILVCPHAHTVLLGWSFDLTHMTTPAPVERIADWLAVDFPSTVRQDVHLPRTCASCAGLPSAP